MKLIDTLMRCDTLQAVAIKELNGKKEVVATLYDGIILGAVCECTALHSQEVARLRIRDEKLIVCI